MEEFKEIHSKIEPIGTVSIHEAPHSKIDPRIKIIRDLRIDTNHPYYIELASQLDMFPREVQCIFLEQVAKDIEEYNEIERLTNKEGKMRAKMDELKNKRKKQNK